MKDELQAEFRERLVDGCPDAIIYADRQGKIRFWNAAATRIFGFAAAEALGQSLDLIVPEGLRARHWRAMAR
jgi:PAS domain S-box-containing protein